MFQLTFAYLQKQGVNLHLPTTFYLQILSKLLIIIILNSNCRFVGSVGNKNVTLV